MIAEVDRRAWLEAICRSVGTPGQLGKDGTWSNAVGREPEGTHMYVFSIDCSSEEYVKAFFELS